MNPETCEAAELRDGLETTEDWAEALSDLGPGWELVPRHLKRAARAVLKGEARATFSRTSGGKLSRYAAQRRRQQRYRHR